MPTEAEKAALMRDHLRALRNEFRAEGRLDLANQVNHQVQHAEDETLARLYDLCREAR